MNHCLTLAALSVSLISPRASDVKAADRPNIVILLTDDQGTLDANCFGSKDLHTPNIDRLAKRGTRFTQSYSHTVCCPARAALLTGRHPQRGAVNSWMQSDMHATSGLNMKTDEVTLGEVLKKAGYRTALFGKWHLGAHKDHGPMKQGFDEFFGIRDGFIDNYNHFFLHREGFHDLYEGTTEVFKRDEFFPEIMVNRALTFLEQKRDEPFFLYVPFNIPHYPEQSLKEHQKFYANLPEPRRSYASMVTTTDAYIGDLLNKLDECNLTDNTIVLFLSDNGHSEEDYSIKINNHSSGYPKGHNYGANGGGGNTGKWIGRKGTFLEGGIRTPAIISYPPKLPKAAVRNQIVTAMDWFPTFLELCNVEKPDRKLDGHSALPVIRDPKAESAHKVLHYMWQEGWCVREGDWKLIGSNKPRKNGTLPLSLHNLADKSPEIRNHVAENPDLVKRLKRLHEKFEQDVFSKNNGPKVQRDPKRKLDL
ncbi:MAG: sulfatase-like hydrolase/transferase [Planctomycetaceae bacterium]|nr:sulfatase-like hydrolase/transferase [Planctomycetaceae bacterium]